MNGAGQALTGGGLVIPGDVHSVATPQVNDKTGFTIAPTPINAATGFTMPPPAGTPKVNASTGFTITPPSFNPAPSSLPTATASQNAGRTVVGGGLVIPTRAKPKPAPKPLPTKVAKPGQASVAS
jgi:hypothetical protein